MLADFGLAKEISLGNSLSNTTMIGSGPNVIVGTVSYISPEALKTGICAKYVDYWALGCILFEMLTGQIAFLCTDPNEFI